LRGSERKIVIERKRERERERKNMIEKEEREREKDLFLPFVKYISPLGQKKIYFLDDRK
jgi:hypothetical protein